MAKKLHVVKSPSGRWSVHQSGANRASRNFETQGEAVTYARKRAKNDSGELYIHNRDGTISSRDSYGKDPQPPRDKQ